MTVASNHGASFSALKMPDGRREPKGKGPCWVCGKEAKGKYCSACSVDVTEARTAYRYLLEKRARLAK